MKAIKVKPVLFKEGKFAYPIVNSKSLERLNYAKNELSTRTKKVTKDNDDKDNRKKK